MKRIYILLTLTLFCNLNLTAQYVPIDSLEHAFNNATSDTARLSIVYRDKYHYHLAQPDKAIAFYQKGYELAQRLNNKVVMSKMLYNFGAIYATCKSDEGTGFQWYQKALKISEEINDYKGCELIYYAMGIVYDHQGFKEKAYEAFLKSFECSEKVPKPDKSPMHILIELNKEAKQFDKALAIAKRSIIMMEKPGISPSNKMFAYNAILNVLKTMPNQEKAINFYSNKATLILENEPIAGFSSDLAMVMQICLDINRQDLVIKYANYILSQKGESNLDMRNKAYAHQFLAEVYEIQKNYPLSIKHYKMYMDIETKVNLKTATEDAGRKVVQAEAERDLLIKQKEIDKQRWLSILGFSIATFVLLGGVVIYRFYKREQERKQELTALNATKDRLFAILSHDLMSPIGTLKNYMSLMDWGVMSQEQFAQSSERLKIKVNNLYNLLENVLHWSITQMKGIKPKVETVNINEVVNEQIALLSTIAETKGIALTQAIKSDAVIKVDRNHLGLIVRNLLQNALKFTPKGGTIHFSREDTEGGQKITIQDTGIGIPTETLGKLFKAEQNANREGTAQEGGTGLGLILTKELVELNGGTINVSSEIGVGTRFALNFA